MKTLQENKSMGRGWLLGIALTVLAVPAAWAQTQIRAINTSQQAGVEIVRIELSEPLAAVPTGFTIQTPPRIAIDLPGVVNGMGRNQLDINQGNLRSANVAQAGERSRVVLNLRHASNYSAKLEGNALVLVLDAGAMQAAPAPSEPVHFAQSLNAAPQALRDIDFRRGADDAGRVVVNLPSNQVGVDIQQQGQNLVVEFLRSSLPENLRRKIDVVDFGTPVQIITTTQVGDRVRMVIEPKGNWEHSAYQSDNQFVLEVRPMKVDPNKLTQGPGYAGDKLSLNFQNIEVRALLQVIADFTNFNVVTSDTVTGSVTLRLKDVPWDQALDIIMQAKGLGLRKSGNVLWIAPKDELATKEKLDLEAKAAIAQLEPLRNQSFQLNYVKSEDIAKGLTGQASGGSSSGGGSGGSNSGTRILSQRGSVIFEPRTNQLFVSDIPSKLEEIQAMIAKIDIPVRQVLIEARIVEANDKFGRSLGVKLGVNDLRGQQGGIPGYSVGGGNYVTVGGNYNGVGAQTNQGVAASYNNTQFVNLPANTSSDAFSGGTAAQVALSLFSATANRFLNLELSALESDGKGKVVSSPRVITADQVKALIEQGEELPYQVATSSGATSVQFRKANLKLEVTPQITPEGSVILSVDVNKDSRGTLTPQGYAINTKHVQTQVLVENGGTVVIGGIYTQDEGETVNKVPLLGDVPLLGNLFKNKTRTTSKTELLIFLTPKVVSERQTVR